MPGVDERVEPGPPSSQMAKLCLMRSLAKAHVSEHRVALPWLTSSRRYGCGASGCTGSPVGSGKGDAVAWSLA